MVTDDMANNEGPKRDKLLENLRAKLRALFPYGAPDAEEQRAEVVAFAAKAAPTSRRKRVRSG